MSISSHLPAAPTNIRDLAATAGIAEHWHDEHQIVYASSGVLAVHTDRSRWIAPAHRALWIPAGTVHSHRAYGVTRLHLFGFPQELSPLSVTEPTALAVTPLLRELLIAYTELGGDRSTPAGQRMRAVLFDQLALAPERPVRVPAAHDPRLVAVCQSLEADPSDSRSLEALGRTVGASARTLTRLFRADTGMTFPQWRTQLRLYHALRLLVEGRSVTSVAQLCGFATTSAFIDVFRRSLGHTPGFYLHSGQFDGARRDSPRTG
ncbi:helix-turn-helix transcriptional regulator [Amycolatopsis rubida]|uniref:HTH-type transcriptional regulator RipA n=1 Tax=Amycolatopsis rubida TaxID=112413 RepID=A0A1I5Z9G0_9PSEU|nr:MULTISPECIES: helix-turn-helix transcriptional regulator [Amycolatopsis]MYW89419.1 helix-turn-helix domain-containing protein [Amycolatopsis rubida]NEC54396.1 helix-turn-helix transcriptional regulator [Amycolatopsis rubida]OAP25071.1 HTH-type transcriptional repressor of iron protein A [Amycolatopsis sp. M39]SFQ53110.1 AraC-type DNA-binding protein [Amycolatopsis rubida]